MSKVVKYNIPCPKCKVLSEQEIYHTFNKNITENAVDKIINDEVNFVECKRCSNKFQVKTSFFFIDFVNRYCFHYNPKNEIRNHEVILNIKRMFGYDSFMADPIVFLDWEIFKKEIAKKENIIIGSNGKAKEIPIKLFANDARRGRSMQNKRCWTCNICDGDETTGCLFHDPTECHKFS